VLCQALVRIGAPDAEAALSDAERQIDELEKEVGRPQLLRARGLLLLRRCELSGAVATLDASAALARSQPRLIQLGRTLTALAEAARQCGDDDRLARVEAERACSVSAVEFIQASTASSEIRFPAGCSGRKLLAISDTSAPFSDARQAAACWW
jgi:hypothetical protein